MTGVSAGLLTLVAGETSSPDLNRPSPIADWGRSVWRA